MCWCLGPGGLEIYIVIQISRQPEIFTEWLRKGLSRDLYLVPQILFILRRCRSVYIYIYIKARSPLRCVNFHSFRSHLDSLRSVIHGSMLVSENEPAGDCRLDSTILCLDFPCPSGHLGRQ